MPWEITIVNYEGSPPSSFRLAGRPDPKPLGEREAVIAHVRQALPELEWEVSGCPPPEILANFSPDIQALMSKPKVTAIYDGPEFSFEIYGFEQDPVDRVYGEIRGEGNPVPFLHRLCSPQGWSIVSNYDGSLVDLRASSAAQWDKFQSWRDHAIGTLKDDEETL